MKLHRIARALAVISGAALVATGPVVRAQCSTQTINYGDLVSCSISPSGTTDTFLLNGQAGDNVLIRATRTSGTVQPRIRLLDPSGTDVVPPECGNPTAELGCATPNNTGCVVLQTSGLHTIQISDCSNTQPGGYNIYVQRMDAPVAAPLVAFGSTTSGGLTSTEADFYEIDAEAGDQLFIRAVRTSGTVWPGLRVLDPEGFVIANACGNPLSVLGCNSTGGNDCLVAPVTGRYKIVVFDCNNGGQPGGYNMYVQRLNAPGGVVATCVGQIETGSVSSAECDTYEFTSLVGSNVTIRATRTGGTVWPGLRLLDSTGMVVATGCGNPVGQIADFTITSAEPYRVMICDCNNGGQPGSYTLQVICNSGLCLFGIYCTAKTNSCGTVPLVGFSGMPSASATSGFLVNASNTNAGKVGILLYSDAGRAAIPFQGGTLCIGAPIRRTIPIAETTGTPPLCNGRLEIDMNSFAAGLLGGSPLPALSEPGTQINTQFWGRDTPNTSLLSNALEYFVCP